MPQITVTLSDVRRVTYSSKSWERRFLEKLGGSQNPGRRLTFQKLYAVMGYHFTMKCLQAVGEKHHHLLRHLAVDFATVNIRDDRPFAKPALKIARNHALGKASDEDLRRVYTSLSTGPYSQIYFSGAYNATQRIATKAAADASIYTAGGTGDSDLNDARERAHMRLFFAYMDIGERPKNSLALLRKYLREEEKKYRALQIEYVTSTTPLPWRRNVRPVSACKVISSGKYVPLMEFYINDRVSAQEAEGNARLVFEACNSHHHLVAALKECRDAIAKVEGVKTEAMIAAERQADRALAYVTVAAGASIGV